MYYRKPFQRSFNDNNDIKSVIVITAEDQRQTWVGSIHPQIGLSMVGSRFFLTWCIACRVKSNGQISF